MPVPAYRLSENEQRALLVRVDGLLTEEFGSPSLHKRSGLHELVLTVLSQNTNDRNRDRAYSALRKRYPEWKNIADAELAKLIEVLRPAGLAPQKAPRIQNIVRKALSSGGEEMAFLSQMSTIEAEKFLLSLPGVGIKTAYCTLVFSYDRPVFPMDTHIFRIFGRLTILPPKPKTLIEHRRISSLVQEGRHKEFHLNLLKLGRTICKPRNPLCEQCPLRELCVFSNSTGDKDDGN